MEPTPTTKKGPDAKGDTKTNNENHDQLTSYIFSGWRTLRVYKTAVFWSAFMGLAGVNWGLDILLSSGVIAVPAFKEDFGYIFEDEYIISANWQIAFSTAASVGGIIGAVLTGYVSDILGIRKTMALACFLSIGAVFIQVFACTSEVLLVGKLLNGVCLSSFISLPTSYAAEVCPVELRGLTTSSMQLYLGIGQLLSSIILKKTGTIESEWAYKIPFALQFLIPVILLAGLPFCPESPWYLIRANNPAEAIGTLSRLGYPSPYETASSIAETMLHEDSESSKISYLDAFRSTDLRRTEIATGTIVVCQLSGIIFVVGYSTYFFQLAGIETSTSFTLSIGVAVLGLMGVVGSWFLIDRAGRRSSILAGAGLLTFLLFMIGILDVIPSNTAIPVYGQVACIIIFSFIYLLTLGPTSYTMLSEVSSSRLRSRTIGLGIVVQSIFGMTLNIVIPLMISPDAADIGGKIGFVFGGTTLLSCIWVFFRVPETKGRAFRELDSMFELKLSARGFKEYSFA